MRVTVRVVAGFTLFIILFFVLLYLLFQIPWFQNKGSDRLEAWLSAKFGSEVNIGTVNLRFPRYLEMEDVYVADHNDDTLLSADFLRFTFDFPALLNETFHLPHATFRGTKLYLHRHQDDSLFNYSHITEAFITDTILTTAGADTVRDPWKFQVDELILDDVFFRMEDNYGGKYLAAYTDSLYTDPALLDFNKGNIWLNEVVATGTTINMRITPGVSGDAELPDVTLKTLNIADFNFTLQDEVTGTGFDLRSDTLFADVQTFSLPEERIHIDDAYSEGTYVAISGNEGSAGSGEADLSWEISADLITLHGDTVVMGNPVAGDHFDPANFRAENINGEITSLRFDSSGIAANLNDFSAIADRRIPVRHLEGEIIADNYRVRLESLVLRTPGGSVTGDIETYTPPGGAFQVDVALSDSRIPNSQLLYFAPQLAATPLFSDRTTYTAFSGTLEGSSSRLVIDATAKILLSTFVEAEGVLTNLQNPSAMTMDIVIRNLRSTASDLTQLAAAEGINYPATLELTGSVEGPLSALHADLVASTSMGDASTDIVVNVVPGTEPAYDGIVSLDNFDLGALLNRDDLGTATLTADIDGRGFNPNTMYAAIEAEIAHFGFQGTAYTDISIEGRIEDMAFEGSLSSNTPGQNLAFEGRIGFGENAVYDFTASAGNINLGMLIPALSGVVLQGNLDVDMQGAGLNNLTGTLVARDLVLRRDGERYAIDSLYLSSTRENGISLIELSSDFMAGYLEGTIYPGELADLLLAHIDQYFNLHNIPDNLELREQDFTINLDIYQASVLALFIPGLESTGGGYVRGSFDSGNDSLDLVLSMRNLRFSRSFVDSFSVALQSDAQQLGFQGGANRVRYNNLTLNNPNWEGSAKDNTLTSDFTIHDNEGNLRYALQPSLASLPETYQLNLGNDLVLNYQNWNSNNAHRIIFGNGNLAIHDLLLQSGGQSLTANTIATVEGDSMVQIDFSNFRIETITAMTGNDSSLIQGTVNGNLNIEGFPSVQNFTSNLTVDSLRVQDAPLGDARLTASGAPGEPHPVELRLTGINDILISGTVLPGEEMRLDLNADVRHFDLSSADELSNGVLAASSGSVTGTLKIGGTLTSPELTGELDIPDAMVNVAFFNVPMYIQNQSVTFSPSEIDLGSFTLLDSAGNDAAITGSIRHEGFQNFRYSLFITTDHFTLSNSSPGSSGLYYGRVVLSSNTIVRGTEAQPVVNARVFLKEGTDITVLVPAAQSARVNREGVVEYIDMDRPTVQHLDPDTVKAAIRGVDLTASLGIDEETKVRVMFDPAADDYLNVTGGGELEYSINPGGLISLTGRYEVQEGNYHFSLYDLVTRDFEILPGSNIVWMGNPLTGRLDIQGIYRVRARARELLLAQAGPGATTAYNERLPFEVNLNIGGQLIQPEITFGIELPESERGAFGGAVNARLQQLNQNESELNRQVFSLIVFNQFMIDDPFMGDSYGGEDLVRSSVSQVLSQQLNKLTDQLLPGVEISFNLESYGEPGSGLYGETDLEVQLSKEMLRERLEVQVAGIVDVSGEGPGGGGRTNQLAGDMSLEYKLTEDGRYRLRAFRSREFENYIIQQYTATGVSMIFARDFDHFSNLFRKPEEQQVEGEPVRQIAEDESTIETDDKPAEGTSEP